MTTCTDTSRWLSFVSCFWFASDSCSSLLHVISSRVRMTAGIKSGRKGPFRMLLGLRQRKAWCTGVEIGISRPLFRNSHDQRRNRCHPLDSWKVGSKKPRGATLLFLLGLIWKERKTFLLSPRIFRSLEWPHVSFCRNSYDSTQLILASASWCSFSSSYHIGLISLLGKRRQESLFRSFENSFGIQNRGSILLFIFDSPLLF